MQLYAFSLITHPFVHCYFLAFVQADLLHYRIRFFLVAFDGVNSNQSVRETNLQLFVSKIYTLETF